MKKIKLTKGQFAKVDDEDFEWLNIHKWSAKYDKGTASYYAYRSEGGREIKMHREIMKTPKGMECDHVRHDTLDNRKAMLRNVTPSQNQMNKRMRSDNTTGVIGVSFSVSRGKFHAQIMKDRKQYSLGYFETLDEAKGVRQKAEIDFFGEYRYRQ